MTAARVRRAQWATAVARIPVGAAGRLVVNNLALRVTADGVIPNPRFYPIAAVTCLPATAVHTVVGDLVMRGLLAWDGPARHALHLTLPTAPELS